MMRKIVIVALFALAIFAVASGVRANKDVLIMNGQSFSFEVADTDEERRQGLSGRDSLPEDSVLVFAFPEPDQYGIWMKDMKFDIDIIWLDSSKKVVDFETNVSPDTYPQSFYPSADASFVVEANAGTIDAVGLQTGQQVEFTLP